MKAASDIYSPMGGKVTEVNYKLEDTPALVNKDCYGKGWMMKVKLTDPAERSNGLSADQYKEFVVA